MQSRADAQLLSMESNNNMIAAMFPQGYPSESETLNIVRQIDRELEIEVTTALLEKIIDGSNFRASAFCWKMLGFAQRIQKESIDGETVELIEEIVVITKQATPALWLQPFLSIDSEDPELCIPPAMLMLNLVGFLHTSKKRLTTLLNHLEPVVTPALLMDWHTRVVDFSAKTESQLDMKKYQLNEINILIRMAGILAKLPHNALLIRLFYVLREKISMHAILADMRFYGVTGGTALRLLKSTLLLNFNNDSLFETVAYYINKIPNEEFGRKIEEGAAIGDTLLFMCIYIFAQATRFQKIEAQTLLATVIRKASTEVFGVAIEDGEMARKTPIKLLADSYLSNYQLFRHFKMAIEKVPYEFLIMQDGSNQSSVIDILAYQLRNLDNYPSTLDLIEIVFRKPGVHSKCEVNLILALFQAYEKDLSNKRLENLVNFILGHFDREIWVRNKVIQDSLLSAFMDIYLNHFDNISLQNTLYHFIVKLKYGQLIAKSYFMKNSQQTYTFFTFLQSRSANLLSEILKGYSTEKKRDLWLNLLDELEKDPVFNKEKCIILKHLTEVIPVDFWDSRAETTAMIDAQQTTRSRNTKPAQSNKVITMILRLINALGSSLKREELAMSKIILSLIIDLVNASKKEKAETIWEPMIGKDAINPVRELIRVGMTQLNDKIWVRLLNTLISIVPKSTLVDADQLWKALPQSEGLLTITDAFQKRFPKQKQAPAAISRTKVEVKKTKEKKAAVVASVLSLLPGARVVTASVVLPERKVVETTTSSLDTFLTDETKEEQIFQEYLLQGISPSSGGTRGSSSSDTTSMITHEALVSILSKMELEPYNQEHIDVLKTWVCSHRVATEIWLGGEATLRNQVTPPIANLVYLLQHEPETPNLALYELITMVLLSIPAEQWNIKWINVFQSPSIRNERMLFCTLFEMIVYRTQTDNELLNLLGSAIKHCHAVPELWRGRLLYNGCSLDHSLRLLMIILFRTNYLPLLDLLHQHHESIPFEMWNIGGVRDCRDNTPLNILLEMKPFRGARLTRHENKVSHYVRILIDRVRSHISFCQHQQNPPSLTAKSSQWSPTMYRSFPCFPTTGTVDMVKQVPKM